jgi:mRNA turnover protein 4
MPKSKRAKVVHLSKTEKKGKEHSEKLFNGVREAADEYPFIFVFRVDNMRNNYLKEVRAEFSDSRYVLSFVIEDRGPVKSRLEINRA